MRGGDVDSAIPCGNLLNDFIEAIFAGEKKQVTEIRKKIIIELGERALIDSSATIAAFNAYPRMADATGIPLEESKEKASVDLRKNLGLDRLKHV